VIFMGVKTLISAFKLSLEKINTNPKFMLIT
jgi:hypothetical protein